MRFCAPAPRGGCACYAPVGGHAELLAYLVRRLLENGANTSFVNRIVDARLPVSEVIADPVHTARVLDPVANPRIPLPADLYAPERRNSAGLDLNDALVLEPFAKSLAKASRQEFSARPIVGGSEVDGNAKPVVSPADHGDVVGSVVDADEAAIDRALAAASAAQFKWDSRGGASRAAILERASDVFEAERARAGFADSPRRRTHTSRRRVGSPRGGRLSSLLRLASAQGFFSCPRVCLDRPARTTCWPCTGGVSFSAYRRGISRSRSSPDRSRLRSRPETPYLRSRPNVRR